MNVAIIGAGFTGLSAAHFLVRHGHTVTVIEQDDAPGGLAVGFRLLHWDWSLEKHYHHWFVNDASVLQLAKDIGQSVIIRRPKTSVFIEKEIFQLDSPLNVLKFPKLSTIDRIRMASILGFLRINPFWLPLENMKAGGFLSRFMGKAAYEAVWEPQLVNKFGTYAESIPLSWFWARIHKRTASLAYPESGFMGFAFRLVHDFKSHGGTVLFNTTVSEIISDKTVQLTISDRAARLSRKSFDRLIVTTPGISFIKIAPQLSQKYKASITELKSLGAINLILRLKKSLLTDGTYWLSMCSKNSPIMAIVEHTNFMSKEHYGNEHIVYVGNYVPHNHPYFSYTEDELLAEYDSTLKVINPLYRSALIGMHAFKTKFAQPIVSTGYSKLIPSIKTPLGNVYLSNMQQVYPWDRGTNYAVELGERVSTYI